LICIWPIVGFAGSILMTRFRIIRPFQRHAGCNDAFEDMAQNVTLADPVQPDLVRRLAMISAGITSLNLGMQTRSNLGQILLSAGA
jgi:hypothetical protein